MTRRQKKMIRESLPSRFSKIWVRKNGHVIGYVRGNHASYFLGYAEDLLRQAEIESAYGPIEEENES